MFIAIALSLAATVGAAGSARPDAVAEPPTVLQSVTAYRSQMTDRKSYRAALDTLDALLLRDAVFPEAVNTECWRHFFRDTIVDVGRMKSDRPVALFYNPLVDVAAIVEFEASSGTWKRRGQVTIVPGEAFGGDPPGQVPSRPAWLSSPDLFVALKATTRSRVRAFAALHPRGESRRAVSLLAHPVSDTQRTAAELRIMNELRALATASELHASVLKQALAAVHLASPSAPDRLEISAVYSEGGSPIVVVISLPDDGHRFALVPAASLVKAPRAVAFINLFEDRS